MYRPARNRMTLSWKIVILTTTACVYWQLTLANASTRKPSLSQKLQRQVSVMWQGQELASALQRLARAGEIELWIDRNVDKQKIISVEIADLTFEQAFRDIAQQNGLSITKVKDLIFVGPVATTNRLDDLLKETRRSLRALPSRQRKAWLRSESSQWPRLSQPKQLVTSWLKAANLRIDAADQIPHDLWPEQALPPTALIDRIVLVLASFELTCRIAPDGKSCAVVPLERSTSIAQSRPTTSRQPQRPRRRRAGQRETRQVFTLRLENQPLGPVLDRFTQQLELKFIWPEQLQQSTQETLVSCDVKAADLDELLRAILAPVKLQHRRDGKRVTIEVKP